MAKAKHKVKKKGQAWFPKGEWMPKGKWFPSKMPNWKI